METEVVTGRHQPVAEPSADPLHSDLENKVDIFLNSTGTLKFKGFCTVLRSQNYLFSAPAPTLSIISAPAPAPAPAPAINCHLKLFYNSSTILIEVDISFSLS